MKILASWLLLLIALPLTAIGQEPVPLGEAFLVNEPVTDVDIPDVAVNDLGHFLVVWDVSGTAEDPDPRGIQARLFDFPEVPIVDQFQLNTETQGDQRSPAVAALPNGEFVAVWASSAGSSDVVGRRLSHAGELIEDEFSVNSTTSGSQGSPSVAPQPHNRFVVAWTSSDSAGTDIDGSSIQARLFASGAIPLSNDFQVNSHTPGSQAFPSVATDSAGNFVVVWDSYGSSGTDTSGRSIQGQGFDAAGTPVGGQFQVNTYTTDDQDRPQVAVTAAGEFMVVWRSDGSNGTDSDGWSIQARVYDADGDPRDDEFQVNTDTIGFQRGPSVTADSNGIFTVTWRFDEFLEPPFVQNNVRGRRFKTTAVPTTGEFDIWSPFCVALNFCSSFTATAVDVTSSDDFVVVWAGPEGNFFFNPDIWARAFDASCLFCDGFESGDTSAWSGTQ